MLKKALVPFIGLVLFLSLVIMPGAALVPGDFSITSPYFGEAVDASEKVKFVWSNAAGADGYKIALRDLTTDEKLLDNKDLGNKRSYSVWLEHDHSYRVAVCAYINGEGEVWQECEFFTIPEQVKATPEIISISASPSNAPAGSLFIFTVRANEYTEEVTIEIDGYSIGTTSSFTTKSGNRIFTIEKVITSAGDNREVVAYALENGKAVSEVDCTITVTESAPAGVPTITSHDYGDKHTVGESLTVSWSAPSTNPDSYNVYVYYGSDIIFSKQDITAKKVTIPGSTFSQEGTYSFDVYAVKSGYKADNPGNVLITVEKKAEEVPVQTPTEPVQPSLTPEIYSVSVSPSSAPAGSEFSFIVTANSAVKKVGVEVDGYSVGTTTSYSKMDDKRVFTISSIITSTGTNREVVAYAYDGESKLSQLSVSSRVTVTDSPSVGVPQIVSPSNGESYTVGDSVTITWSAPATNPDSYNVYLIKNGANTYSKKGITGTYVTIPASYFTEVGTYDVTVYAVKSGYKVDNPAGVTFTVSQKAVAPTPELPEDTPSTTTPIQPPKDTPVENPPQDVTSGGIIDSVNTFVGNIANTASGIVDNILGTETQNTGSQSSNVEWIDNGQGGSINIQLGSKVDTTNPDSVDEGNIVGRFIGGIVDFFKGLFGADTPAIPVEPNPPISTPTETPAISNTPSLKYNAEWESDVEDLKGNKERETALLNVMKKYENEVKQKGQSTVIYFIEGFGKDFNDGKNLNDIVKGRSSALCVVAKDGEIVFACDEVATLPDKPLNPYTNPTFSNKVLIDYTDVPNVCDGVYIAEDTSHKGYPSLNIKSPKVERIHVNTDTSNGVKHDCGTTTSNAINIHKKSSETCGSGTSVNSAGCFVVGKSKGDDYDRFALLVGFAKEDANRKGYAKTKDSSTKVDTKCCVVVDRGYAYENVPLFLSYLEGKYAGTDTATKNEVISAIRGICPHKDMSHEDGLCPKCGYYNPSIISAVKPWSGKVDKKTNLYSSGIKSGNPKSIDTSWVDEKDNFTILGELNGYYLIEYATSGGNFKVRFIEKEKVIPA